MRLLFYMAINLLGIIHFEFAPDPFGYPSWIANTDFKIYFDDARFGFQQVVYGELYNHNDGSLRPHPEPGGPNLTQAAIDHHLSLQDFQYQFCSGTTLNYFTFDLNTYPYGVLNQVLNSNVCQAIVCDLAIVNVATVPATGALNQDGSATVNAISTHGPIKYKLNTSDFAYATDGQLSNIFSSLLPGGYFFVAIDAYSCKKNGFFLVQNADTYAERWRFDFKDQKTQALHRLSIEDKLFSGVVTNSKMGIAGPQVTWRGEGSENTFEPVIPSQLIAQLFSETDGLFSDLFTADEKRFKLKKYINTGNGLVIQWVGFVIPMLYSEPYTESSNYNISVTAADGMGNLSKLPFTNDQGMAFTARITLMEAISAILRKTGLQLSIKESVNLFETTMNQTASDSMLTQVTIDPDVYKNSNGEIQDCLTVLKSLIENIGSRIYMDNGMWNIDFVEQKSATSIPYRVFTYLGVYSSNGTYDPTINIGTSLILNRVVPYDGSTFMNITQNYGTFVFINNLHIVNNLLRGGEMEQVENTGVNPTFKGWSIDQSNAAGISFGLETLDKENRGSKFAAFFDFRNTAQGAYVTLQSDAFTYLATNIASFQLIFDIYTRPIYSKSYTFIDYEVRMNTEYLGDENYIVAGSRALSSDTSHLLGSGTSFLTNPEYNRVYVTENLTWKTIQINFSGSQNSLNGQAFVKFRIWGNPYYDYPSLSVVPNGLIYAPTADLKLINQAPKARVLDGGVLRFYTLVFGTDATSSPDKIRPQDWVAYTGAGQLNSKFWKLDQTSSQPLTPPANWLRSILIDNVQLVYLPSGNAPVENITYRQVTNIAIIDVLTKTFNHGDLPYNPTGLIDPLTGKPQLDSSGNIIYSTVIDANYKYIARGHLELVNGIPTINWKRGYVSTDAMPLVVLLQNLYMGQFQAPKYKLSGIWGYDLQVSFSNTFNELRTQKKFLPNAMTINYADSSMNCEMLELKAGLTGPAPDLFAFSTGFTTGFNA